MYFKDAISYDEMINILTQNFNKIKFDEVGTKDSKYYNFSAKLESESFMIEIEKTIDGIGSGRILLTKVRIRDKDGIVFLNTDRPKDVIEWLIKRYHESFDVEEYRHKLFDEFGV